MNYYQAERWVPLLGYEGKYEVSDYGRVRRLWKPTTTRGRPNKSYGSIFEPRKANNGYMRTAYALQREYTHRLVARHFVPNPNNLPEVNHIDGNKHNNYFLNLEWCTHRDNCRHASVTGLINRDSLPRQIACRINQKASIQQRKRPVLQISKQGKVVRHFDSVQAVAAAFGKVHSATISAAARRTGYHRTMYGYQWVYEEDYDVAHNYCL